LDLTKPVGKLPVKELKAAIDRYGVVVYRNPAPLSDDQHVAFSRLFGPVEVGPMFKITGDKKRIDNPALVDVGNLDADGNIMQSDNRRMLFRKGDRLWHADMSFHPNRATYSLLLGHEIPP
ncbi:MAG: TauD/TfdA family dioxygenase, partial [Xanthobacteraceae bacterium]|nr:TauD/TfdA family dioxygenase [Xanthobacteraceae bacterium]